MTDDSGRSGVPPDDRSCCCGVEPYVEPKPQKIFSKLQPGDAASDVLIIPNQSNGFRLRNSGRRRWRSDARQCCTSTPDGL